MDDQQRQGGKAAAAGRSALNTVEFLEAIILQVPVIKMPFLRRVNKRFRDTIDGSIAIQRAMFLIPLASTSEAAAKTPAINPFLLQLRTRRWRIESPGHRHFQLDSFKCEVPLMEYPRPGASQAVHVPMKKAKVTLRLGATAAPTGRELNPQLLDMPLCQPPRTISIWIKLTEPRFRSQTRPSWFNGDQSCLVYAATLGEAVKKF